MGGEFRAYVLADFGPGLAVVNDTLSGIPIVVFVDSASTYALAFQATVDGQALEFTSDGN